MSKKCQNFSFLVKTNNVPWSQESKPKEIKQGSLKRCVGVCGGGWLRGVGEIIPNK